MSHNAKAARSTAAPYAATVEPAATPAPSRSSQALSESQAAERDPGRDKPRLASAARLRVGLASFERAATTRTAARAERTTICKVGS